MSFPSYTVKPNWVPCQSEHHIYPPSDRTRNLSNADRVLARCLEMSLGPEEVNLLYDASGLCRVHRKHAFFGHKQVF